MPLRASPAGLLGRFAPSELRASRSHSRSLCSLEIFQKKKKCVSIDSKWSKTHKNAKKKFTPLTRFARSAASGEAQPLPLRTLRSLGLRASRSHSQLLCSIGLHARASWSLRSLGLRASRSLPTPCHSQGPKECPCQVSCRSDQNCGR